MQLRRLKKNTILTSGIVFYSLLLSFLTSYARSYEAQFHTARLHNQLDYTRLKNTGITKIIYRVFQDKKKNGGLYFTNTQFRTLNQYLEQLIAEYDFGKLELCAWMISRRFSWINNSLLFDYQYKDGKRQIVRKLDVFNPDAIQQIIVIYKELASQKVDCILIQDDFFLRYNEGFSNWGKAQFNSTTKSAAQEKLMIAENTPYNQQWNRVKIEQLNKVLKLIVENCKMVNSAIKIGINIYYETPIYIKKSETWYSHNLREILDTGVDYIYLMSYHRQIKKEMRLSETRNRLLFKQIVEKAYKICKEKLIVKIQIRDWETGHRIPASEIRTYLNLIPLQVERVCFTPVKVKDFDYLEDLIGKTTNETKDMKRQISNHKIQ